MNLKKYLPITTGILALLLSSVVSCSKKSESQNKNSDKEYVAQVTSLSEFKNIVESNKDTLLVFDLYADWCGPCKILTPTFNSLAATHNQQVKFFRIDVDKNPDIASVFATRAIPYVVFVRDKETIHSISGVNSREEYERIITACGSVGSNDICKKNLESTL